MAMWLLSLHKSSRCCASSSTTRSGWSRGPNCSMKCGVTAITPPRARSIPTFFACGKSWKGTPPIQYIFVLSTERATSSSDNRSREEKGDGSGTVADQVPDCHAADFRGLDCGLSIDCAAHGGEPGPARPRQRSGQLRRNFPQCTKGARGRAGAFRQADGRSSQPEGTHDIPSPAHHPGCVG